jgi:UDP-N-acetylmuramate dehydrogenase
MAADGVVPSSVPSALGAATPDELDAVATALGSMVHHDVPLADRTTYRVGGSAALLVSPTGIDDLVVVASALGSTSVPVLVVGRGSNLLVADAGFGGLVVVLDEGFDDIVIDGTVVHVGAGASLPVVARRTAAAGLCGFEWAVGVPGSIGGAVRMNAGGHGADMAAAVRRVRLFRLRTGEDVWVPAEALDFHYRHSCVPDDTVVVSVELALSSGVRAESEASIADIVAWRRANQPGGANAGSVFTNPPGDSAGRLIDAAGGKGLRIGTAEVSTKHANFIQADPGGSADDVAAVMQAVTTLVRDETGVELVPETRMVGFAGTLGGPAAAPSRPDPSRGDS